MQNNSQTKYVPWDKIHSTYYWKINLKPEFQYNGVTQLTGYSKKCNQNEAMDKTQMLKTKILMFHKTSYLKRITSIEIWRREGSYIDTKNDPKILILFPTSYNILEDNYEEIFKLFGLFLKDFYYRVTTGKSMEDLVPKQRKKGNLDDIFDITKQSFTNLDHLNTRAGTLVAQGFPFGQVTHLVNQYRRLKGW